MQGKTTKPTNICAMCFSCDLCIMSLFVAQFDIYNAQHIPTVGGTCCTVLGRVRRQVRQGPLGNVWRIARIVITQPNYGPKG
jgi:hypothetical protein